MRAKFLLLLLFPIFLSGCPENDTNAIAHSLGEDAAQQAEYISWASGVQDPADFNEFINGDSGVTSGPTGGDCYNSYPEPAPYGERCYPLKGEEWEEIELDGKKVLVPSFVPVVEFIKKCHEEIKAGELEPEVAKENLEARYSGDFAEYSNSPEVENMIKRMRANSKFCLTPKNKHKCTREPPRDQKGSTRPTGYCYKYVKLGLLGGKLTDKYIGGVSAKNAGGELKAQGFKNLMDDPKYKDMTPYTAPKGAIIVYSGGKHGHIEVKAGDQEFISDYVGKKPIYDHLGLPRKPIGIYVK